jgi:hypothetical protein
VRRDHQRHRREQQGDAEEDDCLQESQHE